MSTQKVINKKYIAISGNKQKLKLVPNWINGAEHF